MLNPWFMGYNTDSQATFIINFSKEEEEVVVWTWKKGKWKTKKFWNVTRGDEPIVQSEQMEYE